MTVDRPELLWPEERVGEALLTLARQREWVGEAEGYLPAVPPDTGADDLVDCCLAAAAGHLGLEVEPWQVRHQDRARDLRAPCLLRPWQKTGVVAVGAVRRRKARIVTPEGEVLEVPVEALLRVLRKPDEGTAADEVERVLASAGVPAGRRGPARERLLAARVGERPIARGWHLRPPPGAAWWRQLREAGVPGLVARLLGGEAAVVVLGLAAWWALWRALEGGGGDPGWLTAWLLLLATGLPLRLAEPWLAGALSLRVGWLVKRRLLAGALATPVETVRERGTGRLLGTVLESEAAEVLALDGSILALAAGLELAAAVPLLAWGSGGVLHLAALVAWTAVVTALAVTHLRARRHWTAGRVELTDDLVERMAGHRTRLAQEPERAGQREEDRRLAAQVARSQKPDRLAALLAELPGPGWILLSLLVLGPTWIAGGSSREAVALGLSGMLLGYRAWSGSGQALVALADAAIAAEEVRELWRAAGRPPDLGDTEHPLPADPRKPAGREVILDGRGLAFSYGAGPPVLRDCSLALRHGDRVLLRGGSGAGKSTLVAVLLGLRIPDAGSLLLRGLDRETWGEAGWRTAFTSAPQFHENHLFVGTLAFNLLLGRRWPPEPGDLELAEAVCRELGLEKLLELMPAGLHQVVGEVGWQLSSGERSRVFVARALLQEAPVVVLDESFGALDPASVGRVMECVERRAGTLVVIGHT